MKDCKYYELQQTTKRDGPILATTDISAANEIHEILRCIENNGPGPWPENWDKWHNVQAAHRWIIDDWLEEKSFEDPPFSGRGIVIAGGAKALAHRGLPNGGYMPSIWVLINKLRMMGCNLPVELWHLGPSEMDPYLAGLLTEFNVTCIDAYEIARHAPARILAGWELKPYAVKWSRFEEVLFIDADNTPTSYNPERLFDIPEYQDAGAVFWPDYDCWILDENLWSIMGIPSPGREPAFESGQFMINKKKCWKELCLALKYAEHSDYIFKHVYGDKEVFHLSWRKLGTEYAMPSKAPGWLGDKEGGFCIIQHDFRDRPIFLHRCQDKWKYEGTNRRGNLPEEDLHHQFADEFRSLWNGQLWSNPVPSPLEIKAMERAAMQRYVYKRLAGEDFGGDERVITLMPDGTVGDGAADCERRWSVHDLTYKGERRIVLALCGKHNLTALYYIDNGKWVGEWVDHEKCQTELIPLGKLDQEQFGTVFERALTMIKASGYNLRDGVSIQQLESLFRGNHERHSEPLDNNVGDRIVLS